MLKRREELLNAMGEKELRAFIKGYMMAERTAFKHMKSMGGCAGGCGSQGCSCAGGCQGGSCGSEDKECNCEKQ